MSGRFLVLEGIDGCGKTTQLDYLAQWLPTSGLMPRESILHITREPGGTSLGEAIRNLLLHPPGANWPEPTTELLLYAADRAQHVSQLIIPALEKGDWVLSDRFSGSTLAYQGFGRNLDVTIIEQLEEIATSGITPDLTLFLDIPIEESIGRRASMVDDRIEAEGHAFLSRVAMGFSFLATKREWVSINANQQPEMVSEMLKDELVNFFASKKDQCA